jgi:sec-independent protein translocase protein TatA
MRIGPLGGWEILIILVVVLLIFGSSRLPKIARGLGESARELRKGFNEIKGDIEDDEGSGKTGSASTREKERTSGGGGA